MKDRIFPTLQQDSEFASEKEFSGIDWDRFAESFNADNTKEAAKLPEGLEEILGKDIVDDSIRKAEDKDEEEVEDDETSDKPKDKDDKDDEGDEGEMVKQGRMRKVHFSSVDQISAEAIEKAKESGSEELVNTILAARKQRRVHLASKIMEAEDNMVKTAAAIDDEKTQKLQKRDEYRKKLAAKINDNIKTAGTAKPKIRISVSGETDAFKSISAFNSVEKKAFAETAIANGFPEEYVAQILGDKRESEASVDAEKGIKEIMASSISLNIKKSALEGMIKTAELDEAQKQRIIDYWIKDLQYGDEEWVRNWVNKNYD